MPTFEGSYYDPHFTNEETEAQRNQSSNNLRNTQ